MKISIVTSKDGDVVATYRHEAPTGKGQPAAGLIPARGQTLHEIDLPHELESATSVDEFHRALKSHLKKKAAPKKKR